MKYSLLSLFWSVSLLAQPISYFGSSPVVSGGGGTTNLTTNLVFYAKMDETGPGTRNDSWINGLNLTDLNNNVGSTASGIINRAADLNGATGALRVSDNAQFQVGGNQDFSWAIWVNAQSVSLNTVALICKGTFSGSHTLEYAVYFNGSHAPSFAVENGSVDGLVSWGSSISDSAWHLIITWYNHTAQTVNIQVDNGSPVTVSYTGGTQSTTGQPLSLMNDSASTGFTWTRQIDEVAFAKRVWTSSERSAIWNSGAGLPFASWPSTP